MGRSRIWRGLILAVLTFTSVDGKQVLACPFCDKLGKTISDFIAEADAVAHCKASPTDAKNATTWVIKTIIKPHPNLKDGEELTLAVNPTTRDQEYGRLVFLRIQARGYRPTKMQALDGSALVDYLMTSQRLRGSDPVAYARHLASHFESPNPVVAEDAYKSVAKSYVADLALSRSAFEPQALRRLIQSESTPSTRIGLLGILLGLAGTPTDTALLARLADSPEPRFRDNCGGLLAGLTILDPEVGIAKASTFVGDRNLPTLARREAGLALAFIFAELPRRDTDPILTRLAPALEDVDVADLVIDAMRREAYYRSTNEIIAMGQRKENPAVRSAAIRFALRCPKPAASVWLINLRQMSNREVIDAEQALRFEQSIPIPPRLRSTGPAKQRQELRAQK